jgi:hypothetical protein
VVYKGQQIRSAKQRRRDARQVCARVGREHWDGAGEGLSQQAQADVMDGGAVRVHGVYETDVNGGTTRRRQTEETTNTGQANKRAVVLWVYKSRRVLGRWMVTAPSSCLEDA